ncbi:protein containing DUF1566 [Candidatus Magnetobacterium bavaricum]|uniref:Protein containing DUF1566 n=1 Tax=Candidatus Magnetobacterium bavaricum TaxID=29290 RepID=A0A0F3GSC1_9BACT|nr:protein containing DUF1566 [Candidatus Magnetobacterium bavaricum]
MPEIELAYNKSTNRHEGIYNQFTEKGTYEIAVFAMDDNDNITTSPGNLTWSGNTGTADYTDATTVVTLTVVADADSTFTGWGGDCSGTDTTCTVAMTKNMNVTAIFALSRALKITITGSGGGNVTALKGVISWNAKQGVATYADGTVETLTAVTSAGSTFIGWGGDCSGTTPTCTLTMSAAKNVTATFNLKSGTQRFKDNGDQTMTDIITGLVWTKDANLPNGVKTWQEAIDYAVSMNNGAGTYGHSDWRLPTIKELYSLCNTSGVTAEPKLLDYCNGNFVDVTSLLAGEGFTNVQPIEYWSSTNFANDTSSVWRIAMYGGIISPTFKTDRAGFVWPVRAGQISKLVISKVGTGFGTVTSADGKISCGGTCSASYTASEAAQVTLTAKADANSTFTAWGGDCSGTTSTCTLTMSAAKNVTATFTAASKRVTHDFDGDGKSDILWHNIKTGAVAIWFMNGSKYFSHDSPGTTEFKYQIAGTGDFNGDGKTDILWQNLLTGEMIVWLMDGKKISSNVPLAIVDPNWKVVGIGDFNGNGKDDVVWQHSITGVITIWLHEQNTPLLVSKGLLVN